MATIDGFRKLLNSLIITSKVTGVEMWTAPGKFVPASYYLSFHVFVYFVGTIYTLRKYADDPVYMMKVLITLGIAVQLYIKIFVMHWKADGIKKFSEKIESDILEVYQNGSAEETAVLKRNGRYLFIILRILIIIAFCAGTSFGLYPLLVYYVTGEVIPLFLYELPFCDWRTTSGYVISMLFQVNLLVIGIVGSILSDFLFLMYVMYAIARADILIVHLRELEILLNDNETNEVILRQQWRQCMYDHQQSTEFLNNAEDYFGLMCLVQVVMGVFTICDGMVLVVLTDWYPPYCFMMVGFFELTIYFVIGHIAEVKIDEMYDTIISMPWYKLPVQHQKEFNLFLCRQQRPMMLTAYGFHPLNFEAYMSVLKRLYQFFVLILQYVGSNND
uniref:Uncharacterized protein n=1 Tax=Anopheles dirus TaxID=7168 RepID=A0A182NZ74_9DIPT